MTEIKFELNRSVYDKICNAIRLMYLYDESEEAYVVYATASSYDEQLRYKSNCYIPTETFKVISSEYPNQRIEEIGEKIFLEYAELYAEKYIELNFLYKYGVHIIGQYVIVDDNE